MRKKGNLFWKFGAGVLIIISILSIAVTQPTTAEGGSEDEIVLNFSFQEPVITEVNISNITYHLVTMNETPTMGVVVGVPALPVKPLKVLLPQQGVLESINVTCEGNTSVGDGYTVMLGPKQVAFNSSQQNESNESNFDPSKPYPTELCSSASIHYFRGYTILVFNLYPVHYTSDTGEIYYYENMTVTIETDNTGSVSPLFRGLPSDETTMKQMVDDYSMNHTYTSIPDPPDNTSLVDTSKKFDYVIITRDDLVNAKKPLWARNWATFQDLADYKNAHGINTTIVNVSDITGCSYYWNTTDETFNDTQAQIRNFTIHAYQAWGIEYVLLGGDSDVVPERYLHSQPAKGNKVVSDLYYACLDGSYNAQDPKDYWGQPKDGDYKPGSSEYEPAGGGTFYAETDSYYSPGVSFDIGLFTPAMDLTGQNEVTLFFERNFKAANVGDYINVSAYSGGTNASTSTFEEELLFNDTGDGEEYGSTIILTFDPSTYTDPGNVYIQFYYNNNDADAESFNIDDVNITVPDEVDWEQVLWESFEGKDFPPDGWEQIQYSGEGNWMQQAYEDDLDMIAEVYVGRACVDTPREVSNFVYKTLAYDSTPANYDYIGRALMVGVNLSNYEGHVDEPAKEYKNEIRNYCDRWGYQTYGIPEEGENKYIIDTLYDADWQHNKSKPLLYRIFGWPPWELRERINEGRGIINVLAHGEPRGISRPWSPPSWYNNAPGPKHHILVLTWWQVLLLSNNQYFFMYSQSCGTGNFSWRERGDCLAEFLTVKTKHGAFAVIMNTNSGYLNTTTTNGMSQRFDREFFDAIYRENIYELGKANQDSKEDNLNWIKEEERLYVTPTPNYRVRQCYYIATLFGDPTLSIKIPEENHAPNPPTTPEIYSKTLRWYTFTTSTTDPDGDQVQYQFKWDNHKWPLWTRWYNSSETGYGTIRVPIGTHQVSVRARDKSCKEPSDWSDLLPVAVSFNSDIQIVSSITVLGEETQFYGQTSAEPYATWYYDLGDGNNSEQQNTTHTYNTLGTYNVTLTVTNDQNISSNVTRVVSIVLLKSDFDSSDCGTIYFNDTSDGYHTIINWSWNFGEGNISYDQNTSHEYPVEGVYNVSLTVTDNESNTNVFCQTIYIDSGIPEITSVSNNFDVVGYGSDVTFTANLTDSISGVKTVKVNVTYPDSAYGNFTMNNINGRYEYVFNDTWQLGDYSYIIWVVDNADNSICSPEYDFIVYRCFGYNMIGDSNQTIWDTITGSRFTVYEKSVADNITVYLDPGNATSDSHYQCMIYRHNDSKLMGISEEKNISGGKGWHTFNFSVPKPVLMDECVLGCWADNYTVKMYYNNANEEEMFYDDGTSTLQGHYFEGVYNYAPDINNFDHEDRKYSIYCRYSPDNTSPDITNVSDTPGTVGFGFNITIAADVIDDASGVETVKVNITYPDSSTGNFTMDNTGNSTYEYVFDIWLVGQYDYTIWTVDYAGNSNSSTGYSFSVSAEATISVCIIKDEYGDNEAINLTDPPGDPPLIGYELLDGGKVLHIWNRYDSYYFNTSSGIQLTNHYEEYWSHNVLMLGYYNNDEWNLIYRADELSGFNKNIDSDNENYVNATLWKDLTYSGYSFRLAIRYHLGVDDDELTVIPYIKNLGQAIPYVLGFAWEINDIQVDMTPENDYIEINGTAFYLNETIDVRFTNMTTPVYCWNETTNETYACGYEPIPYFYIKENLSGNRYESLYLRWDDSLEYMVQVESRDGEYNAPVTLAFKVGTLDVDQEKYTELLWHDASEVIYYFNSYNEEKIWNHHPEWMVDGDSGTLAGTETQGRVEWLDGNDCPGTDIGAILKVEIRANGRYDWGADDNDIILTPLFEGYKDGNKHIFDCGLMPPCHWSSWFDITTDENAPEIWTWNDVSKLACLVEADSDSEEFELYCSRVEIRVIFIENTAEEVYFFIDEFESDWEYPEYMVDGDYGSFAYIIGKDEFGQYCLRNTCEEEDLGAISKVELRAYGYREGVPANIFLTPVFGGENNGIEYIFVAPEGEQAWSEWFDITDDAHAPETWSWSDVKYLDCRVRALGGEEFVLFCSKIEIQVKYTPPNNAPEISNPYPVGSSGISISPTLGITVSDPDGDTMDITWYSNSSGSWVAFGSNSTVGSGTYYQIFADASVNGQWWYWKVKVSDGNDYTESSVYKFYTGYQSKIKNTGSTDIRGYLLMQVHFFDEMLEEWVVADDTVNETNPRTINAGQQLGLDTIFNGLVNTNDLSEYGSGTYRVYAAFRDPDENILKCDDETELEAWYEFDITFN